MNGLLVVCESTALTPLDVQLSLKSTNALHEIAFIKALQQGRTTTSVFQLRLEYAADVSLVASGRPERLR